MASGASAYGPPGFGWHFLQSAAALQLSRFAAQKLIISQLQLDHRYKCPPIDFCDPAALLGILRNSPNASNRSSDQENYQTNIPAVRRDCRRSVTPRW